MSQKELLDSFIYYAPDGKGGGGANKTETVVTTKDNLGKANVTIKLDPSGGPGEVTNVERPPAPIKQPK